jgi:hypothetical protein
MLSLSFMGGRLAYYVLEGVSFVLARSRRALLAWLIPQGEPFVFDARSVLSVREHDKRATCLREAAPAKAGNAALPVPS